MGSASHADPGAPLGGGRGGLRILVPVAALVLVLDQVTKWWAVEALDGGRTIDIVWTLRFRLVRNDGAAFSLGTNLTPFIAVTAIVVSVAVVAYGRRTRSRRVAFLLGMVLGGALGNVVDRMVREGDGFLHGAVVDFVDLQWWPVWNLADASIVVGGILLVLVYPREVPPPPVRPAPAHAASSPGGDDD